MVKKPKFDLTKLMELHSDSLKDDVGTEVDAHPLRCLAAENLMPTPARLFWTGYHTDREHR